MKKSFSLFCCAVLLLSLFGFDATAAKNRAPEAETTTEYDQMEEATKPNTNGISPAQILDVQNTDLSSLLRGLGSDNFDLDSVINFVKGHLATAPTTTVVVPETTVSAALNALSENGSVLHADGTRADDTELVGTGMTVISSNGDRYLLVVMGDIDGDGEISAADARLTLRLAVGLETYAAGSAQYIAADYDKDNTVSAADARLILRAAVGLGPDEDAPEDPENDKPELPGTPVEMSKQEILDLYSSAVHTVRSGAAGYDKKAWQKVPDLKLFGVDAADSKMKDLVGNYTISENTAPVEHNEKGTDDAIRHMPDCTLSDLSRIKEAACTTDGGNYFVKIVLVDETDPQTKDSSFLGQITNTFLAKDEIDNELNNISVISDADYDLTYHDFTVYAEITPDGQFVSILHSTSVQVQLNSLRLLKVFLLNDKTVTFEADCSYTNFNY